MTRIVLIATLMLAAFATHAKQTNPTLQTVKEESAIDALRPLLFTITPNPACRSGYAITFAADLHRPRCYGGQLLVPHTGTED